MTDSMIFLKVKSIISANFGMTLLEVLFTIMLLSIGIVGVANMQIVAFQVDSHSSKITLATTIVQDVIEALMAGNFNDLNLADNTAPGVFTEYVLSEATLGFAPPAGIRVQWEVDEQINGTKDINVIATWQDSGYKKSISLPLKRTEFQ
jgi:hypothetical protein